jgi:O-acetyl-ADP-ribose deacetylase (regulator of RNase III)
MIELARGDLLAATTDALVNPVNCVGVMGKGLAAQFKSAYPANFRAYAAACERKELAPGRMLVVDTGATTPRWIINFPTKRHWRGKSRLEDIEAGLLALVADVRRLGITSIAIPPLGYGLGGLDWADIRPRIERAFAPLPDIRVLLFAPA